RRQPLAHGSDPDRAPDRHHHTFGLVGNNLWHWHHLRFRRSWSRQDRDIHRRYERGGDGEHYWRHPHADSQRRWYGHLLGWLGHHSAHLQLYRGGQPEHR